MSWIIPIELLYGPSGFRLTPNQAQTQHQARNQVQAIFPFQ